tara:strand:- start:357 stop:995 length:639 start_codon:yes stop_codon:yes gene_type:complete
VNLFLDTADVKQIEDRLSSGLISGVTTNPTLIRKVGRNPWDVYTSIIELGVSDLSIEVFGDESKELIQNGLTVHENYGNVATVKLPCTPEGLKACKYLTNLSIKVNMTLVFSLSQAILCSLAGATYVSPFVGRLDDNSLEGLSLIKDICDLYRSRQIKTKVLAASIRDVQSVGKAFGFGADICTIPPKVFDKMADNVLTDTGLAKFKADFSA